MNLSDPLDRLRAANPVLPDEVARARPDPVLFQRIISQDPAGARRRASGGARRWARRLAPALLVSTALAGAGAYGLLRGDVTDQTTVACYERADLAANTASATVGAAGAVAACAEKWQEGSFESGTEAPALVECVLDSGVRAVFPTAPGQDVCALLNLPPTAPTTSTTAPAQGRSPTDLNARIAAFREAVNPQFLDSPCVEPRAAAVLVRRELDRAGLSDWTIRGGEGLAGDGFSAERPCATLALRAENREVVLVPAPARR